MSFASSEPAASWMVTRSRGMVAAAGLGTAVSAVYAVLAAIALTTPNVLSVPGFGNMVRAEVGVFTATEQHSQPAHRSHVHAAVANVPPPAAPAPAASSPVSDPAPASHDPAPKGHGGQHAAVARHDRRHHRHSHHRRHGDRHHGRHHHHWLRHGHAHHRGRHAHDHHAQRTRHPHTHHHHHHRSHARG